LNPENKAMFDALKSAADFWWQSFEKRREYQWKINLSIWTVLVAYIGFVVTGRISVIDFQTVYNQSPSRCWSFFVSG
jgi:hypothetical protein